MQVNEIKSDYSYDESLKVIKDHLPDIGFGILFELPFDQVLKSKGHPITTRATLLEICKPELASGILNQDTWFAYMLPCKILVRTADDGVYVGYLSPRDMMVDRGPDQVGQVADQVEQAIRKVIGHVKKVL